MCKKRTLLFLTLGFVVLFLGNGCAAFREFFSTPELENSRPRASEPKRKKKKDELQSRRYNRDPLDSLFFTDRQKSEDWSRNSNLSDSEKSALRHYLNPDDNSTRQEIDRIYRDNERKRKKRQDEVFGPNPFRN